MEKEKITICEQHNNFKVPLISTFAFNGAELWCPYCGDLYGIFEGREIKSTQGLENLKKSYTDKSKEYLKARCSLVCSSLLFEGKRIKPSELPKEVIEKYKATEWKYWIKLQNHEDCPRNKCGGKEK